MGTVKGIARQKTHQLTVDEWKDNSMNRIS